MCISRAIIHGSGQQWQVQYEQHVSVETKQSGVNYSYIRISGRGGGVVFLEEISCNTIYSKKKT
jgi:hypothetical protein